LVSFTPGPSELYVTVPDHLRRALKGGVPSLSHRSKAFESIFRETTDGLRELIGLPQGYHIAFVSSATEIWERSIQSLVDQTSYHLVDGAFSKKYSEISKQLGKQATAVVVPDGTGFDTLNIPCEQELVAFTQNETSTGVSLSNDLFRTARQQQPQSIIIVDVVSSLPYVELDFAAIDSAFFSVQKCFGLPAGLGVWIYNDRCVDKAQKLLASGNQVGTYHNLTSLHSFALKNQTPSTPNVLSIYLLGKVIGDFLRRGIGTIRRETDYKATLLYDALQKRTDFGPFVKNKAHRSQTVVTLSCPNGMKDLVAYLESKGLSPGEGYGVNKATQLRFANFPAHSKETYELLVDSIASF